MKITLEIRRFNPDVDGTGRDQSYEIEVQETDRVLDALEYIKTTVDGSLGFRRSCAHGVCGSDAMRINGVEALACRTLFKDIGVGEGGKVRLEPLRNMEVQRDLMVDQSIFLEKQRSVTPFFVEKADAPADGREYLQSPEEREAFDEATMCIQCGACYSACPVVEKNPDFIGPAAIIQAARFAFDSRDKGLSPRLAILDSPNGVWSCDNHYACTKVCPRGIKITKIINQTKRLIEKGR